MTEPVFFEPSRGFTLADICDLTGARLVDQGHASIEVCAVASAAAGGGAALIYVDSKKNAPLLGRAGAAAVICSRDVADHAPNGMAVLVSSRPQYDFVTVSRLMFPQAIRPRPLTGERGVSAAAHVDARARLEEGVIVEAGAVIGSDVEIGRDTVVAPNSVIGAGCRIGRDCFVGPGAVLQHALIGDRAILHGGVQLGQDGFGFVSGPNGAEKVPQLGRVVVQDDVEIGANTTVDRGALSDTVIGAGTKIDNLVQIAHNVRIGRSCLIAGQCGLSGSVVLGDGVMLGGGVGLSDHLTVGDGAGIMAGSGVMNDVPAGERWGGSPAQPIKHTLRQVAWLRKMANERKKNGDAQ